jgi:hypothetical protein
MKLGRILKRKATKQADAKKAKKGEDWEGGILKSRRPS